MQYRAILLLTAWTNSKVRKANNAQVPRRCRVSQARVACRVASRRMLLSIAARLVGDVYRRHWTTLCRNEHVYVKNIVDKTISVNRPIFPPFDSIRLFEFGLQTLTLNRRLFCPMQMEKVIA